MVENLHFVKELWAAEPGGARAAATCGGSREIMNVHWERKKQRSRSMSNPQIDGWYELAMRNGALGGKLIGAGGGGFLLFYAEDKTRLRRAMAGDRPARGALPLRFRGHEGRHPVR